MARMSFLLPVYNGEMFLSETIDSLLGQSYDDFDITIIDDGSTDSTVDVLSNYDDSRIKYYYKENNGLVSALNYGIEVMDCEYIARIDADDCCAPNRLISQLEFMQFTSAVAVSGRAINIDSSGNHIGISAPEWDFFDYDPHFFPAKEPYLPHPFLTIRLDVLQELGGFRNAHLAEDTDLCWRLHQLDRIALQKEILGKYRIHDMSISTKSPLIGRVQAFYSQVASMNAIRRLNDQPEIPYDCTMAQAKNNADSFDNLITSVYEYVSLEEIFHLRMASIMKYLDLATWRHHYISQDDIKFANNALKNVELSQKNKDKVNNIFHSLRLRVPELFENVEYDEISNLCSK